MKRRTPRVTGLLAALLTLSALLALVAAPAAGAGEPARLAAAGITATPDEQAVGGQIEVRVKAFLQGNPHKTLYGTDLRSRLELSANAEVVSGPDPDVIPLMEVPASVATYPAIFVYRIRGTAVGNITMRAEVTSRDSGGAWTSPITVPVKSGLGIAAPRAVPDRLGDEQPLRVVVNITNPFRSAPLVSVRLCSALVKGEMPGFSMTGNGSATLAGGGELVASCRAMLPVERSSINWTGTLPAQGRPGTLVYWVWAATPHSATGGEVSSVRVYGEAAVRAQVAGLGLGTLLVCVILAVGLYRVLLRNRRDD